MTRALTPVTPQRKALFLRELERTGSVCAAARAATPHRTEVHGGLSSFRDAAKKDPNFALAIENAKQAALGRLEALAMKLAEEGDIRPIFDKQGRRLGEERRHDSRLVLAVLGRLSDEWVPARRVEHSGQVSNLALSVALTITPADLLLLPAEKRVALTEILGDLGELKARAALPPPPDGNG